MSGTPQQKPLNGSNGVARQRPEWRAFIVRDAEDGKQEFITLASFFRNKNGNLSGKATLRHKVGENYEEMPELNLKHGEFINLSPVK